MSETTSRTTEGRPRTHAHVHEHTRTCTNVRVRENVSSRSQTKLHTHVLKQVHMHAFYTRTRTRTRMRAYACTHTRKHTRIGQSSAVRTFYARGNTRVRQPHVHNTLALKHDTETHANTPLTEDACTIARPRIHRYPPPRAIKTRRRRSTLHSARAPAHRARSGAPAMSPRHHTIVHGVTQSRAQPPLRPALRGKPSGGSRNAHTQRRTQPGRPPRTHARV